MRIAAFTRPARWCFRPGTIGLRLDGRERPALAGKRPLARSFPCARDGALGADV